jgi:protein involved in polysaccharide export with SLBB domain
MIMKKIVFLFSFLFITSLTAQTDNKTGLDNLLQAGTISVTIGGDFIITGSFPALITERVDQFVTRTYNEAAERILKTTTDPALLDKLREKVEDYSLRDITLKRSSGEVLKLDLQRFRINGDFSNNPYLKNDDVIIFPSNDIERNFFTVEGAVNMPGKFLYADEDDLQDALELAGGINKAYENVDSVKIYRLSYDGQKMETIKTDINSFTPLVRGDRIVVTADETQKKEFSVLVVGEVNSPGKIPITKSSTSLKDVIKMAGGLRKTASLKRTRLYSGNTAKLLLEKQFGIKLEEQPEIIDPELNERFLLFEDMLMYRMSNLTEEDSGYFFIENQLRIYNEGSSFNLLSSKDSVHELENYIVHDGDILLVPQKRKTIFVFGQVPNPGHVDFVEGKNYKYYVDIAGGLGEYADDDIMIIKGDTRNWVPADNDDAVIEEGDYIWVPKNPVRSFDFYMRRASNYLSIVGPIATIILLIVQINK